MAFNLENMTIDYKKMLRMIPSDRATLAQSGAISDLISSLTPGQLVNLFPRYYRDKLPDVGQAVSSLGGALSGATNISGRPGGGSTYSPDQSKPLKSPSAEEKAVQELLQEAKVGQYADLPEGKIGLYRPAYSLTDADLSDEVIRTIAGEARLSSKEGVDAVINVMLNRVGSDQYGSNLLEVASQGHGTSGVQFEGFNKGKVSEEQAEYIRQRIRILSSGAAPDNTFGANEFRGDYYVYGKGRGKSFYRDAEKQGFVNIGGNIFAARGNYSGPYQGYDQTEVQERLKQAEIESASQNIQSIEDVMGKFEASMIDQLDERLRKYYTNADPIQKKNFEDALGKLGTEKFNETLQRQPLNNATIKAASILKTSGDSILDPSLTRVSQDQDQLAGTRKLPLQQELVDTMNYAAQKISEETGRNIYFKTFSGGQASLGSGGPRTGSTEHDLGGAADNYFIEVLPDGTERMLSMSNPDDKSLMYKTAYHFARAGGRSVGLETGYMGNESIHLGISRNNEDPTHHADKELSAVVDQGKSEFLQEAKEKGWDPQYGYKDFYLQEKQKRQKEADAKLKAEAEAIAQSDPVTAAQNNMQPPEPQQPTSASPSTSAVSDPAAAAQSNMQPSVPPAGLSAVEIPPVAVPALSYGGTVEMPPAVPGEGIAGVDMKTGALKFVGNDRELYTQDDQGNLRVDPSTIRREDQKVEMVSAEPQRVEAPNQPVQRRPEQPMPVSTPDPNFLETMSSGSMSSSPSQLRALNRAKLYGDNSGNLVNGHFS
jgi:hypothetical protein